MGVSRAIVAPLLVLSLAGCALGEKDRDRFPAVSESSDAPASAESLRADAVALLDAREQALVDGDREAFLATVDPDEIGFSSTQARWFDNLALLPVDRISFDLDDADLPEEVVGKGDLQLPVDFTMRLRGFDARPVTQQMIWTFAREDGKVYLSNERVARTETEAGWTPAPWDLTHIEVRESGGILAVFDKDTRDHADYVMSDLAAAEAIVRQHLPSWNGRFVAYGSSDTSVLRQMSPMTVDDTAGVAFPVLSRPDGPVAAYRFLVNPTVVSDVVTRSGVFRHEMVHVALGTSDDASPVWLVEGVAEYVARSPLQVDQRRAIAAAQLASAQPRTLPADRAFYAGDATGNYTLAALVCDYLATTRGEDVLWDLIRTFASERVDTGAQAEAVVQRELGESTLQLTGDALGWARGY